MKPQRRLDALLALGAACAVAGCATQEATPVVDPVSVQVQRVERGELFDAALAYVPQRDEERADRLAELFLAAGCPDERLERPRVAGSRHPNLLCTLPGQGDYTIVVGAHYDFSGYGIGLSDDWSGLAMLPLLYQALSRSPREHSFVFAGFSEAAKDNAGSESYLRRMLVRERARIAAMVNLKGLGLGDTAVWFSRADPDLRLDLFSVSRSLGLPLQYVDLARNPKRKRKAQRTVWPIQADAHTFRRHQIPAILIHSYDRESARLLQEPYRERDFSGFRVESYADSLRLVSVYLAYLDQTLQIRRER